MTESIIANVICRDEHYNGGLGIGTAQIREPTAEEKAQWEARNARQKKMNRACAIVTLAEQAFLRSITPASLSQAEALTVVEIFFNEAEKFVATYIEK